MSDITIRLACPEDVFPAIDLARRMCSDGVLSEEYTSGQWHMFVACDSANIVGMVCEREGTHISRLCVEPAYQRQGIATKLMDAIIAAMAVPRITMNSSPNAVPFYLKYGCVPMDEEQRRMEYIPPITIRPARPEEIAPALELARLVFQEYIRPSGNATGAYDPERESMFVALDGEKLIGMVSQADSCHIRKLYVDGKYHRRGIATGLMDAVMQSMGSTRVTVNSSAHAMPFYLRYGFTQAGETQHHDGFSSTPMAYEKGA